MRNHFAEEVLNKEMLQLMLTYACLFVCLFVYSRTNNFSTIWRLSPLPVTGLQI
jgi:hypothetical protein